MQFGLTYGAGRREDIRYITDITKYAEELGFDAAFIIDSQLVAKDAFVILTACAVATSKIQLGTGVTNPVTRDITVLASTFSALDELSDGRAILGIGAGGTALWPLGKKRATLAELESSIHMLRGLLRGETVQYDGHPVRIPAPRPNIPILVSATLPRMLELAGRVADGVIILGYGWSDTLIRRQFDSVMKGLRDSGRDRAAFTIDLWITIAVSPEKQRALDEVRSWVASSSTNHLSKMAKDGTLPDEIAAVLQPGELEAAADSWQLEDHLSLKAEHAKAVSDGLADALTIAGPRDYCTQKLIGLTQFSPDRITLSLLSRSRAEGGRKSRLDDLAAVVEGAKKSLDRPVTV